MKVSTADINARLESRVIIEREPETYGPGSPHSFFKDVFASFGGLDSGGAEERLRRHQREQAKEIDRRSKRARDEMKQMGIELEVRDLTRTDGSGGHFVPPLQVVDDLAVAARSERVLADRFNVRPLPLKSGDTLTLPRVSTGVSVLAQTADNAVISEVDLVDASVSIPIRTLAGQTDASLQLLEQSSPRQFDEVIFADLTSSYNQALDSQLLNGTGSSGQILGLRNVSGANAVSYADASPTAAEFLVKLGDALRQIGENRGAPATTIILAPRRWYWLESQSDTTTRPIGLPQLPVDEAEEGATPVGSWAGCNIYVSNQVPTNLGTNEDVAVAFRGPDAWLWESIPQVRVLNDPGSGTLTSRLQLWRYVAATAARHPSAISTVTGTGMVAPTW